MGWSSGSQTAEELWNDLKPYISSEVRGEVARLIVDAFERQDADDWSYEEGSLFRTAYPELCEEWERGNYY